MGDEFAKGLAMGCFEHWREAATRRRAADLKIRGLDEQVIVCTHVMRCNLVMPLVNGGFWNFVYTANIIKDSELCGMIGITTLRLMSGIVDTVNNNVIYCGPGII